MDKALYKFGICKEMLYIKHFIVIYTAKKDNLKTMRNICHEFGLTIGFFTKQYLYFLTKLNVCFESQIISLKNNFFSNVYIIRGNQPLIKFVACYKKLVNIINICDYSFILNFAVNRNIINLNCCLNLFSRTMKMYYFKFCVFYLFFIKVALKYILKIIFYPIYIVCRL